MRKMLTALIAAVTFGGAVAGAAVPAQARPYDGSRYYHRHHDRNDNDAGVAIAAGVVGLALGAALASSSDRDRYYDRRYYGHGYYDRPYYGRGYYDRPYYGSRYYGYGHGYPSYGYYDRHHRYDRYRVCTSKRWVWDPYIGRRVLVRQRYAC